MSVTTTISGWEWPTMALIWPLVKSSTRRPGRILDEGACRPFGDERRPGRAVAHEVTSSPLQISASLITRSSRSGAGAGRGDYSMWRLRPRPVPSWSVTLMS